MGYRSEVFIKMEKELEFKFELLLLEQDITYFKKSDTTSKAYSYYYAYDLKWYSNYSDVKTIENFIKLHSNKSALIAIGEDNEVHTIGNTNNVELYTTVEVQGFEN